MTYVASLSPLHEINRVGNLHRYSSLFGRVVSILLKIKIICVYFYKLRASSLIELVLYRKRIDEDIYPKATSYSIFL